jgi:hypothetical protein
MLLFQINLNFLLLIQHASFVDDVNTIIEEKLSISPFILIVDEMKTTDAMYWRNT